MLWTLHKTFLILVDDSLEHKTFSANDVNEMMQFCLEKLWTTPYGHVLYSALQCDPWSRTLLKQMRS